jgi:hypothetical protein
MGTINAYRFCCVAIIFFANQLFAGNFDNHKQTLQNMVTSISDIENEIKTLIHHKRSEHDRESQKHIMKEIEEKHKKLEEAYKKYNEEVNHVKYRHPEQGDMGERTYTVLKPRTLEQIENDVGLEGKLDRIRRKMEAQYHQAPLPPKTEKQVAEEKKKVEEKPPERIILKK